MKNDVILAIFLGILSYSMLNIGMGLQKKGASSLPKINEQKLWQNIKNFLTSKPWVIGFLMVQVQWASLSFALDLASVSVITPLMSFGMVALILFAYFYLKEPISKVEFMGIGAIIGGIVLMGLTTPREESEPPSTNPLERFEYVLTRLSKLSSIGFLLGAFLISILLIFVCISRKYKNADILFGISAGITDALGALLLRAFMGGADFRDKAQLQASSQLWSWWVLMFTMIIVNFVATIYLQVAYQRGKAVIVAPIFTVLAMIVPVFGGILIFEEWNFYFIENKLGLMAGKIVALVIISIGAITLSMYSAKKERMLRLAAEQQEKEQAEVINGAAKQDTKESNSTIEDEEKDEQDEQASTGLT